MSAAAATISTLVCEGLALLAIATVIGRRVNNAHDYFLAGRRLGAWLAAGSECFNTTGALTLFAVAGAAFEWGFSAVWIWLGLMLGYLLQWTYVGPRLFGLSREQGTVTVLHWVTASDDPRLRHYVIGSAVFIVCACFLYLSVAELRFFGATLEHRYDTSAELAVMFAVAVIAVYAAMGGIAAISAADSIQCLLLGAVTVGCAVAGFATCGGWPALRAGLSGIDPQLVSWMGGRTDIVAVAFVGGTLGLGLNLLGQPHSLQRFLVLRDSRALQQARALALVWAALITGGAVLVGWCIRIHSVDFAWQDDALFELAHRSLPASLEGLVAALWLGAVVAALGSQLLVVAACIAVDLRTTWPAWSAPGRTATVLVAALCGLLALYLPVPWPVAGLNAWSVLGAAFGPLLLVRLTGKPIRPRALLGALWAGTLLTLLFQWLPAGPGDFLDRILPFAASLGIALTGGNHPQRNAATPQKNAPVGARLDSEIH